MSPARQQLDKTSTTRVYQYGAVPTGLFPEAGIETLYKANRLWNTLVETHNAHREQYEAARCAASDEYARLSAEIRAADEAVDRAYDAKRLARGRAGTKDPSHPLIRDANDEIQRLQAHRRELWAAAKSARKVADQQIDKPALNKAFRDAVQKAGRVAHSGVSANTAGQVLDNFQTARDRAFKEGARLQFHRFDGTGYWFFRFSERGATQDGVPFDYLLLNSDDDGRPFTLTRPQEARKKPRLRLRVKVAGGGKKTSKVYAAFDVILHRPIPDNAQIQNAKLLRTRTGDKFTYSVSFTLKLPRVESQPLTTDTLGVDIGFRQLPDGRVRVAAIGGSHPLDECRIVEVSKAFVERLEKVDAIKSQLDESATTLGTTIKGPLDRGRVLPETHPRHKFIRGIALAPEHVTLSFEQAYKLARWTLHEPGVLPSVVEQAARQWWQHHGRRYRELHNLRRKALSDRKHEYRRLAAELVKSGRPIGFEAINLTRFAEHRDRDNLLSATARSNRFLVSPSELVSAIKNAASRVGVPVVDVGAAYTSKTCSDCGVVNQRLTSEQEWTCERCGVVHDRDANAAVNIARRAAEKLQIKAADAT